MNGIHDRANVNWGIKAMENGLVERSNAQLAVLMDIRLELQRLNELLHCRNFLAIPSKLHRIAANTGRIKPQQRKKKKEAA